MFAPGAGRWIGPPAVIAALLAATLLFARAPWLPWGAAAVGALLALSLFFTTFFRDPERPIGSGIVSPADGRIRAVDREGERWRISVFMNVTDVHVNRAPVDARLATLRAAGDGFRAAFRADADRNVRKHYEFETELGPVEVVQITGVVARRIVSWIAPGAAVRKGDRFGMIVLGSRVDLCMPAARTRPVVRVGDRVRAGVTTVAELLP